MLEILPRLIEKYTENEFKDVVEDYLDEVTASALYQYFGFRRVNTIEEINGVDVWEQLLKNQLLMINKQYKEYLRIETVEIDPIVTDYLERQILKSGSGTTTSNKTVEGETEENGTTTGSRTETPGVTETKTTTGTTNTTGNDDTTTTDVLDRSVTETRNTTDTTTGSKDTEAKGDNRSVSATLPVSETYSGTGTVDRDSGLPSSLFWSTVTAQAENDSSQTSSEDTTTTTTAGGTVGTVETGSPSSSSENDYDSTVTLSQTEQMSRTGTNSVTDNNTTAVTGTNTTTEEGTVTASNDENVKERMTGRSGRSPQELLEMARNYVLKTNSFKWLCSELNKNFVWMVWYI